jgi:hypothetical protein
MNILSGGFTRDCFDMVVAFISLAIWITFTELTIAKNRFVSSDGTIWQFRQVGSLLLFQYFQRF